VELPANRDYRMKCAAPTRCRTLTRSDYADYCYEGTAPTRVPYIAR
jgi:hypothetical protein